MAFPGEGLEGDDLLRLVIGRGLAGESFGGTESLWDVTSLDSPGIQMAGKA